MCVPVCASVHSCLCECVLVRSCVCESERAGGERVCVYVRVRVPECVWTAALKEAKFPAFDVSFPSRVSDALRVVGEAPLYTV